MTAIFNTKFTDSCDRNGQKVEILDVMKTRDGNRYTIKFQDGHVIEHAYENELDFKNGVLEQLAESQPTLLDNSRAWSKAIEKYGCIN